MSELGNNPWEGQGQLQGQNVEFRPERIEDPNKAVLSMGEWVVTLILYSIPCVNIIMLCIWAFGNGNENRKNFSRAALIIVAVSTVLSILFSTMFLAAIMSAVASSF